MFNGPIRNKDGQPYQFFAEDDGQLSPREPGLVEVELHVQRNGILFLVPVDRQEFEEPEIPENPEAEVRDLTAARRSTPFNVDDFTHQGGELVGAGDDMSRLSADLHVWLYVLPSGVLKWQKQPFGGDDLPQGAEQREATVPQGVALGGNEQIGRWLVENQLVVPAAQ